MTAERPEMRLLRESLESVVAPSIVSTVVFEALEAAGGRLPEGADAARSFVDGPLRAALTKRLGPDADSIVDDLVQTLAMIAPPPPSRREDITQEVYLDDRPVIVAVIASSEDFASKLVTALGEARVAAVAVTSQERLRDMVKIATPQVVLVDAADFAPIEPEALAQVLGSMPATTVRAIWGADLPFGAGVMRELTSRGIPTTPFDRREGIEPLLDLVRSRRTSR